MVSVLHTQVAQSLGVVISAAAPDLQSAVFLAPMSAIPQMLLSGFFVLTRNMPVVLKQLTWAS